VVRHLTFMREVQIAKQGPIRAFIEDDVEQVASLSWRLLRYRAGASPSWLNSYFEELFFRNPWRDDALPSLVYEDVGGKIIGFLGVVPRPMTLRERTVRVAYGGTLVVEPSRRCSLAGLSLVQAFLSGNQDLSLSDSANDVARRVWTGLGGSTAFLQSLCWSRPLRPTAYGLYMASRLKRKTISKFLTLAVKPLCNVVDSVAARVPGVFRHSNSGLSAEDLDAQTLLGCLSEFSGGQPLRAQNDQASLAWLLDFMSITKGHGELRKLLLTDTQRNVVGWYVYFVKRGGVAEVAQIGARRKSMGQVLDHLFLDAWNCGALAVHGQFDPMHAEDLRERCCFFYRRGSWLLVHSRDFELQQYVLSGNTSLTRLDGEWCMGFPAEDN
jgi:hypothetical protein